MNRIYFLVTLSILLHGCATLTGPSLPVTITEQQLELAKKANISGEELETLESKPIYKFTPKELDKYLGYLQLSIPDLRDRVKFIARKNLGQPYQLYLLGEYPFEIYDADPLYCLDHGDCVVFSEHTYAMALGWDWSSFFAILQRIRYKNGEIGYTTRNHYTELDWDINNSWLVEDITLELAGDKAVAVYSEYNKNKFFKKVGLETDFLKESLTWYYIPYEIVPDIANKLNSGDFVNIVRGYEDANNKWVGHVGMIMKTEDGTVNFLHSTPPAVKEQSLIGMCTEAPDNNKKKKAANEEAVKLNAEIKEYNKKLRVENEGKPSDKEKKLISSKPYFYGFKFFRLRENPLEELHKIEGDKTPLVIGSQGLYHKKLLKQQSLTTNP